MTPSQDLKLELVAVRERLLAAIAGVNEEQFKRRPQAAGDDKPWCIAEVLGHLLQQERLRGERITKALAKNGATVEPVLPEEQDRGAQAGRVAPVPQLIHGLLASRREIERSLDEAVLLPNGLARYVVIPGAGDASIEAMLRQGVIEHEAEHVAQILSIRAAVGATPSGVGA